MWREKSNLFKFIFLESLVNTKIPTEQTASPTLCSIGHETYESDSKSKLGIYKQFAVAVDSPECSTVGK